jgi:hypothetical protein
MAFEEIGIGTIPNDTEGDTLRAGGIKINNNFAKAVEGAASSTSGRVAVFADGSGKLLQNGVKLEADLVTGPASSNDNRLALFNLTSGKDLKQAAFDVDDVARLSQAQTFTGAKTFSQTSTTVATTAIFFNPSNANNTTKEAQILFRLADTINTVKNAAAISSFPDGVNVLDAGLRFLVRAGDTDTLVERMRIAGNGKITAGAGTHWVGTVAQSSSSAVVEAGTNANGRFVKFADGTQICWIDDGTFSTSSTSYTQGGVTYYRNDYTWTFPAAFSTTTNLTVINTVTQGFNETMVSAQSQAPSTTSVALENFSVWAWSSFARIRINAVASGRWY